MSSPSVYAKKAIVEEISQIQDYLNNPKDADHIENHCDRARSQLQAMQTLLNLYVELENPEIYRRMTA